MTTTTSPLTADVIRQAAEGIDSLGTYDFRPSYQGCGMSEPCVGVVVESPAALIALGASIAYVIATNTFSTFEETEAIDDAIGPMARANIDSMGRDFIVYWPGVTTDTEENQS